MVESIDFEKCICCETCVEVCPMDVFRIDAAEAHSTIRYPDDCQTCYNCELECPVNAIRVNPFRKARQLAW